MYKRQVQQVIENPGIVKTYLEKYMPSLISFLVQLVVAIVILLIGIKVIKSVVKIIKKGFDKSRMDAAVALSLIHISQRRTVKHHPEGKVPCNCQVYS